MSDKLTVEDLTSLGFSNKVMEGSWILGDDKTFIHCYYNRSYSDWDVFIGDGNRSFHMISAEATKQDILNLMSRYNLSTPIQPTKPKTVRFRIAVAIDEDGCGRAYGWHGADKIEDNDKMEVAEGMAAYWNFEVAAKYWVEVDIPLPVAPIEGTVVK